ncbi:DoxX family membrane protein [Mycobacterium haemophilum]|uniref:Membrane protein n=1 Tax=Mycobacterium haemophilum TaxID=29311 RepID=A0A0I9TEF0_9MYCO|nr:DoxX family membrane protein [Mycobacterium haemophilum]KLO27761.1 membrane protein [Mycobacterium haemophilum]KLO35268.1 membrane protein [Mycobacterium haemophilum]KLO40280.1 membrane protein [Mycobacterium haemophilum]KLO47554.1 membrane protein [Mycobacterium haemophilum]
MSTKPAAAAPALADQLRDPAYSAYLLLRTVFTVAPILFGLDKFFNLLTRPHHWSMYLAGWISHLVPGSSDQCMYLVGVIEIAAGVLVAVAPRIGAWVVAAWLAGIIVDLLTLSGYYDIALRDFGLLVGAIALARLAQGMHDGSIGRH